jgi:hypothetical protein
MAPVRTLLNRTGRARATPAGERLRARAIFAPGSTGSFGHRFLSPESLRRARADLEVVRRLRGDQIRALHLTSQHLARFGPLVGARYVVIGAPAGSNRMRGAATLASRVWDDIETITDGDMTRLGYGPDHSRPHRLDRVTLAQRRRYRVDRVREHRAIELLAAEASQTRPCSSIPFGPTHVQVPGKPSVGPNGAAQASVRGPTGG